MRRSGVRCCIWAPCTTTERARAVRVLGMSDAVFAGMRSFLLASLTSLVACTDETPRDDADNARDEGNQIGEDRADQVNSELGADSDLTILAKSGAIMVSIDQGEIELADLALDLAIDPTVRDFAQRMVDSHGDHVIATHDLLASFAVDPQATPISIALDDEARVALDDLGVAADFDYEYMRMMVSMHAEAFVIVGELANQQEIDVAARFFADTTLTIGDHRNDAEVIFRGL